MKLCAILLLISCTITLTASEYSRFKRRGMPGPPRQPPYPQYVKKWQQQPHPHHRKQSPQRLSQKRHIPVHMPTAHKIPLGMPIMQKPIRPMVKAGGSQPVRAFWKQTQTTFKTPIPEKPIYHHHHNLHQQQQQQQVPLGPEKSSHFLSSPSIPSEYDFHIQTNSIPTHTNPIKQVGEKGPIHTIPAPNLSLADRPIMVEEVKHQQPQTYTHIQKSHQYHVTESPEHNKHKTANSYHVQSSPGGQVLKPQEVVAADFYQLLNAYQQPQQGVGEQTYNIPTLQDQYLQLPQQTAQLFQPDQNYVQQILNQNLGASDKSSVNPEMHSFNYDEQENRQQQQQQQSSLVTSTYNVEPAAEASETVHSTIALRNPLDSLAQSQYVQNYFDTREEQSAPNNKVDPVDAKPSQQQHQEQQNQEEQQQQQQQEAKDDEDQSGFYSSLPNKQAADALASLQAAGKVNSNLAKIPAGRVKESPMKIYVPDDGELRQYDDAGAEQADYDDYGQDDMVSGENQQAFGSKITPKRS